MATRDFKLNHATVQKYLDGDYGVEAMLQRNADLVLAHAASLAPVESGDYRASLHVVTEHTDRMVKRVTADVEYAGVVEAEYGVLARSLDGTGVGN